LERWLQHNPNDKQVRDILQQLQQAIPPGTDNR